MFCGKCGKPLSPGVSFCEACGTKVNGGADNASAVNVPNTTNPLSPQPGTVKNNNRAVGAAIVTAIIAVITLGVICFLSRDPVSKRADEYIELFYSNKKAAMSMLDDMMDNSDGDDYEEDDYYIQGDDFDFGGEKGLDMNFEISLDGKKIEYVQLKFEEDDELYDKFYKHFSLKYGRPIVNKSNDDYEIIVWENKENDCVLIAKGDEKNYVIITDDYSDI